MPLPNSWSLAVSGCADPLRKADRFRLFLSVFNVLLQVFSKPGRKMKAARHQPAVEALRGFARERSARV